MSPNSCSSAEGAQDAEHGQLVWEHLPVGRGPQVLSMDSWPGSTSPTKWLWQLHIPVTLVHEPNSEMKRKRSLVTLLRCDFGDGSAVIPTPAGHT